MNAQGLYPSRQNEDIWKIGTKTAIAALFALLLCLMHASTYAGATTDQAFSPDPNV